MLRITLLVMQFETTRMKNQVSRQTIAHEKPVTVQKKLKTCIHSHRFSATNCHYRLEIYHKLFSKV